LELTVSACGRPQTVAATETGCIFSSLYTNPALVGEIKMKRDEMSEDALVMI
jgi:hypothetical protein